MDFPKSQQKENGPGIKSDVQWLVEGWRKHRVKIEGIVYDGESRLTDPKSIKKQHRNRSLDAAVSLITNP